MIKPEWKTKVQSVVTFMVASAALAWIGTESSDFVHALPDWLEVPAYGALTALAGAIGGYLAKHKPADMSESAISAVMRRGARPQV